MSRFFANGSAASRLLFACFYDKLPQSNGNNSPKIVLKRNPAGMDNVMQTKNMKSFIIVALLSAVLLWMLHAAPTTVNVYPQYGVLDMRSIAFDKTIVRMINDTAEFVPNQALTPGEFAASGDIVKGAYSELGRFFTMRLTIIVPENRIYAFAGQTASYASKIYVNGELLTSIGSVGASAEGMTANEAFISFTASPKDGKIEIVQQSSNFMYDDYSHLSEWHMGLLENIEPLRTSLIGMSLVVIGIYLVLFFIHLMLFFMQRSYRANLYLALLCFVWIARTGVIGEKLFLRVFPALTWELAFRFEYISIPAAVILLLATYHELFPGTLQKPALIVINSACAGFMGFYMLAETFVMSKTILYMELLAVLAAVYLIVRLAVKVRAPNEEQSIVLIGLGAVLVCLILDVLYYNSNTFRFIKSILNKGTMEYALILFSILLMSAIIIGTVKEFAAARAAEERSLMEIESLRELNLVKEKFLGSLSHELKLPITVISGFAQLEYELLEDDPVDRDALMDSAQRIDSEAKRMERMVMQLLDMSAIQTGSFTLHRKRIPLIKLFSRIESTYFPIINNSGNRLTLECPEELYVFADAERILQVLINLVSNAQRYTRQGEISLTAVASDSMAVISVSDTGSGIDPGLLPTLFEREWEPRPGGQHGLGLTISRAMVEVHGGELFIADTSSDGTTVTFTLPTEEASA